MLVTFGISQQGLNRLRKKGKEEENLPNGIPQGLKQAAEKLDFSKVRKMERTRMP